MSAILGHDCHGRPLRAGDRAVYVRGKIWNGCQYTVVNADPEYTRWTGDPHVWVSDGMRCKTGSLRKLTDDNKPADCDFETLMDGLKTQRTVNPPDLAEDKIRQPMPWEE